MKPSSTIELGDYLPYLVNRVGTIIAAQFSVEALEAHGLSIAMWRVMVMLAGKTGLRQIDLADLTSIEVSTLSRLVTRMVRMGLVTRARAANSDREVTVKLSAKGKSLVARLIPVARHYEVAASAGLTRDELTVVKRALRRVYDNMKKRPVLR